MKQRAQAARWNRQQAERIPLWEGNVRAVAAGELGWGGVQKDFASRGLVRSESAHPVFLEVEHISG